MKVIYDSMRNYIRLNSLRRGEFARSVDGKRIYGCVQIPKGEKLIFELTDMSSQYFDQIDLSQKVYLVERNERLIIQIT